METYSILNILHFFTDIKHHGVAGTYDGAPVMKKMGRMLPTEQQTCHAHGTHLSIWDIFYPKKKKANENDELVQNEAEDDDDEVESNVSSEVEDNANLSDDESDITDTNFICDTDIFDEYDDISDESSEDESDDENDDPKTTEPLSEAESGMNIFTKIEKGPLTEEFDVIFKVRKIYKFISKSPVANGALQEEVKSQLGMFTISSNLQWSNIITLFVCVISGWVQVPVIVPYRMKSNSRKSCKTWFHNFSVISTSNEVVYIMYLI